MDAFVWFPSVSESECILPYLPEHNLGGGGVKTKLCSEFNKLGLWATYILAANHVIFLRV